MSTNTINEIKEILINAGYEKELNDILFIEDLEPLELEPIDFEPLEFDELY